MNRRTFFALSLLAASAISLVPRPVVAQQKTLKEQLVGAWSLVSFESVGGDGSRKAVFAGDRKGLAIYDPSGRYTIVTVNADRPRWKLNNRSAVTQEEWASAARNTIAQFGDWSVDEANKTPTRHIEQALNPNNQGAEAKLSIALSGDELGLTIGSIRTGGGKTEEVYTRVK